MSFSAFAVRACLVQAIRGQTLAGDSVVDSPSDPVALAAKADGPVISVSSRHERLQPRGRSLLQGSAHADRLHANTVDVVLRVFLPANPALSVPDQPGTTIDAREAGAAFAFDLIWRQITRALALDDENVGGAWADLWRRAVNGVVVVEQGSCPRMSGSQAAQVPAREIVMRLDVLDEPAFGALQSDFWPDFVAAAKGCGDLAAVAPVVEAALSDVGLPDWRSLAALLGLRPADMAPLSLGPLGGGPGDPIVAMAEAAVDGRGVGGLVVAP